MTGPDADSPADAPGTAAHVVQAPTHSFVKAWRAQLTLGGKQTLTELFLRPKQVFAYTSNNDVYGFDRATGSSTFAADAVVPPGKKMWAPIVLPDYLVFPSAFTIEVYSTKGDLVRSQSLPFGVTSNGCAGDGAYIFIGGGMSDAAATAAGRLACVDVSNPYVPLVWSLVTGGVAGSPAYSAGTCFVGGQDGAVYAVDSLRHSAWSLSASGDKFMTDAAILGDVVADGAGVYVASWDTRLYCIDRQTGKLRWQYFAEVPLRDGPVVTASTIYQMVPGKGLGAILKTSTGAIRKPAWFQPDALQFLAEDDRYVYLRMKDNSLLAADKTTGAAVFHSAKTDFVAYAGNPGKDGTFYAGTADGHVYQIAPVLAPGIVGEPIP
jgi:outer membrane protein assembly factor BamB